MKKFYQNKNFISVVLSVVLTFAFVVIAVDASTTISTAITTEGALTVSGLSTLGYASTTAVSASDNINVNGNATTTSAGNISSEGTLTISGLTTLGYASTTAVSASDNININGNATTTSNGNIVTEGTLGVASSTPAEELGVTGDAYIGSTATTTVHIKSTGATKGGCIEMEGSDDVIYRIYVTGTTALKVEAGTCGTQ